MGRFTRLYIESQLTPDELLYDKSAKAFIIKGGQLYSAPARKTHGDIALEHGISYGDGQDVSGRVSKDRNVCAVWDYAGNGDPYSEIMANGLLMLFNNGWINSRTGIFITGSNINGMAFASYLRNYAKYKKVQEEQEQPEAFSAYAKNKK